jgi:hypothetical protein
MRGTGTQADPFYPTNWTELAEAVGTAEAYVQCPSNALWDMNEIKGDGLRSRLVWRAKEVYGNGLQIKNLYIESGCIFFTGAYTHLVYKLDFLNMWNSANSEGFFQTDTGANTHLRRCNISGEIHGGTAFDGYHAVLRLDNDEEKSSSINIRFQGGGALFSRYTQFQKCYIVLSGSCDWESTDSGADNAQFDSCYVTGETPFARMAISTTTSDNVFDIYIPEGRKIDSVYSRSLGVVNTDKISGSYANFIGVTAAQMTDATYLQSIGFPIVV